MGTCADARSTDAARVGVDRAADRHPVEPAAGSAIRITAARAAGAERAVGPGAATTRAEHPDALLASRAVTRAAGTPGDEAATAAGAKARARVMVGHGDPG
jgi:hypothetical protein